MDWQRRGFEARKEGGALLLGVGGVEGWRGEREGVECSRSGMKGCKDGW